MVRRRRGDPTAPVDPVTTEPLNPGAGTQIQVTMKGGADDITKRLGVHGAEKTPPQEKTAEADLEEDKRKFTVALRNSKYILRVKRITPREFNGVKTAVEVWAAELPLSYQEIRDEVAKESGGGKYRAAVIDPNTNTTLFADVFEVDGDPLVPEMEMTQEEADRILLKGTPKTANELSEEGLEQRGRLMAKMIEVESLEARLDAERKRRTQKPENGDGKYNDDKLREFEREVLELRHKADLERVQRESDRKIDELRKLISDNSRPQKASGESEVGLILKQMQASQDANDRRFSDLMKTMNDDKMGQLMREVQAIKNRPAAEGGGMVEAMKSFMMMAKMMGMDVPGGTGEDDDDDDEDKPWYEKLADRYLPKLLDMFEEKTKKGETVSREEFMKEMAIAAKQAEDEAVENARRRVLQNTPRAPLPPPPPPAVTPAQTLPPPPVSALPPPPPPPPAAPARELPQALSIEQEILIRVGGVLEMLEREMGLRPNEYHWNYEGAYLALPEAVLEQACAAADPVAMVDAFAIKGIEPTKLAELKATIAGNPRVLAWVKAGHDELKEWYAEKLKDPQFDPFADEEEEEA
jgi:hypothetical protein